MRFMTWSSFMRQLIFTTATVVVAGVSTGMAGPVISSASDAGGGAPPFSVIESGGGSLQLEFGGAGEVVIDPIDPIDSSVVIGATVTLPPPGEGSPPPPLPAELPPLVPPVLPPVLPPVQSDFIGTGEGIGGVGTATGPGETVVPVPLAIYGGLSLMLLPVAHGVWRRARHTAAES
jgi:hypothetical protein